MPSGGGDASLGGKPAQGKPHQVVVPVPVGHLQKGINTITIANKRGSWVVYDALRLMAPAGTHLAATRELSISIIAQTHAPRGIIEKDGKDWQPVDVHLCHAGADQDVRVRCGDASATARLTAGDRTVRLLVPWIRNGRPQCSRRRRQPSDGDGDGQAGAQAHHLRA